MEMAKWKKNVWIAAKLIPIGGGWGFAVGVLENGTIRIAKGQQAKADPEINCPISQAQKLNLKRKDADRWEQIKAEVDALMYPPEDTLSEAP